MNDVLTTAHTQVIDLLNTTESLVVGAVETLSKPFDSVVYSLPFSDTLPDLPKPTDVIKGSFDVARASVDAGFGLASGFSGTKPTA